MGCNRSRDQRNAASLPPDLDVSCLPCAATSWSGGALAVNRRSVVIAALAGCVAFLALRYDFVAGHAACSMDTSSCALRRVVQTMEVHGQICGSER